MTASHVREIPIKCTLGIVRPWHEVWPLKPPQSSDWLTEKTSGSRLVELGGLALDEQTPDKMQRSCSKMGRLSWTRSSLA